MPTPPAARSVCDADRALIDGFLLHLQTARGRQQRTVDAYRLALDRLCEFLDGKPLAAIDAVELEAFAGMWLHKRGIVALSRKPYVSAVRGFYAWMKSRGHAGGNAAADLRHPKTGKPLPHALSLASAEKLMWAPDLDTFAGIRDAAILALLVGCGLRVSGLVGMNEGDVRNGEIDGKVRLLLRVTEKGDKTRELPVPREAEMLLRVYLEHGELLELDRDVVDAKGRAARVLFVNARNTSVPAHEHRGESLRLTRQSVWRLIQRYGKKAGVPAEERHPHAFRHLFGVELAEDDVDLLTRQTMMGHADPKSTSVYTAMTMRRKARVMDTNAPLAKIKSPVSEVLKRL